MSRLDTILEGIVRKIGELSTRISRIETIDIPRTYRGTTSQRNATSLGYSNQATFWDTDEQALYVWDDNNWVIVGNDAHVLATTSGIGTSHTVSGLTARQVLIASSSTDVLFRALQEADIPSTIATDSEVTSAISSAISSHAADVDAHHNRDHVLASTSGLGSTHTVSGLSSRQVLIATGSSTAIFRALQEADIPSTIATDSEVTSAISSHASSTNAHHNRDHVLASTSGLGSTHTVSGLSSRQVLIATGSTTAIFRALQEADIPSTIATDSEVAALFSTHATSSDHDGRYYTESEFSSNPGASSLPLKSSAAGLLQVQGLAAGGTAVASQLVASQDARLGRGIVVGSATQGGQTGVIMIKETSSPVVGVGSGYGYLWCNSSNQLWFSDDSGTSTQIV